MKKDKYIIVLFLSITFLFLGTFYFIINDNRKLTIIEALIKEPILFIQKIVVKPIDFVNDKVSNLKEINKLEDNLKKQDKELQNYNILKNEVSEKNKKIEELQGLLDIKSNLFDYDIINANVINRNVGHWYQTFTIDKGENDDIKINQAVITSKGLIGKIVKTTPNSSVVKLLTSTSEMFQIAVLIDNDGEDVFGILSEYKDDEFVITGLSYNKEIKPNSQVTTSGLDNNFPSDLIIGKVTSIKKDNFDLEQIVNVKPSSNFDDINYVSILRRKQ